MFSWWMFHDTQNNEAVYNGVSKRSFEGYSYNNNNNNNNNKVKGTGYTWNSFSNFRQVDNFRDFLFASLHAKPLLKRCLLK